MAHSLRRGLPRLYRNHSGPRGRAYRAEFERIRESLGTTPIPKSCLHDVAMLCDVFATWRGYADQVAEAERLRRQGTGRRPSAQAIRSVEKRLSMAAESYQRMKVALEARLAALSGDTGDLLADLMRQKVPS